MQTLPPTSRAVAASLFFPLVLFAAAGNLSAQAGSDPLAPPRNGPRVLDPCWYVLRDATVHARPGATLEHASVEIRAGRIGRIVEGILDEPGARVFDAKGLHVYAGFIEPYLDVDAPAPDQHAPGAHWSPKVTPQRSARQGKGADPQVVDGLRKMGFCSAVIVPKDGVFRGSASLVSLASAPSDRADAQPPVYAADILQAIGLSASFGFGGGPGPTPGPDNPNNPSNPATPAETGPWDGYPNSLMGAIALVRQTLIDAAWETSTASAPRTVLAPLASARLMFDVSSELDVLRAMKIASEFHKDSPLILGSGSEYRRLAAIVAAHPSLIIPIEFPQKPRLATVAEVESTDLRDLMSWEQAPTNPRRLHDAGLTIALTSAKLRDRTKFMENLRTAIRHGLKEDDALAMLTTNPAAMLGAGGAGGLGEVSAGAIANLVVTDAPLFKRDTKVRDVWIDGRRYEINAAPPVKSEGEWQVAIAVDGADVRVAVERGDKVTVKGPAGDKPAREVRFAADRVSFVADYPLGKTTGASAWAGLIEGDTMTGTCLLPDGTALPFSAIREDLPASRPSTDSRPSGGAESAPAPESAPVAGGPRGRRGREEDDTPPQVPETYGYPFGPYALDHVPDQPDHVLFEGATVWTSATAGTIENGYVLVERGRIVSVGATRPDIPEGTVIVDAKGKHVTPGLIDCHSHTGISRGVNESGQTVTAEVRIQDVTDPDSVAWYRELAGGLTTVNSLHGSANPIGGQNCVNKIRWGVTDPDQMHLLGAMPGIKFALGENVKQSSSERAGTRYPQTRMGVETLIRDRFTAAREYAKSWATWESSLHGPNDRAPHRDLELEALAEILAGKRLVHCHSYRQDEILMLCRLAKEFGFKIGTFQHVLEGYKVADAIRETALGGSTFSDWWAYKVEVQDAIPENGAIMREAGVVVSFNSDSDELARRMNLEAAKAIKYGNVAPAEALKFVTLNPAKQLRIEDRVGSLEPGKDADIVVWSADPLSIYSRCEQTWIDGRQYFSLERDAELRQKIASERQRIIQKVLAAPKRDEAVANDGGEDRPPGDGGGGFRRRRRPGDGDGSDDSGNMKQGDCGCGGDDHE